MALKKTIETNSGVSADYLKVEEFEYRGGERGIEITIGASVYINEAARRAGKSPIDFVRESILVSSVTPEMVNLQDFKKMGYLMVKTIPAYSAAVDC